MLLFTIFMALWAVYTVFVLPVLWIFIDNETGGYFDVESNNKDYFLMSLKWFMMILPGVAVIKAYKLCKEEERKEN